MKKTLLFLLCVAVISVPFCFPRAAEAKTRVGVGVFIGRDCCYYGPYWYPRRYIYPPYYPPRVVYAPPPEIVFAPPPVIYTRPAVVYSAPPVQASIPANQISPTFTDSLGRACREYETSATVGGETRNIYGTACLQPDGAWRVVD